MCLHGFSVVYKFSKLHGNEQRKVPRTRSKQCLIFRSKHEFSYEGRGNGDKRRNEQGKSKEDINPQKRGQNKSFGLAETKQEKQISELTQKSLKARTRESRFLGADSRDEKGNIHH